MAVKKNSKPTRHSTKGGNGGPTLGPGGKGRPPAKRGAKKKKPNA